MRIVIVVLGLGVVRVAAAAPASQAEFDACRVREQAASADAAAISDPSARAEALMALPRCIRNADGTFDVEQPPAPPPADHTPFTPHFEAALHVGAAYSEMITNSVNPSSFGPFLELEGGYHFQRRVGVALFGAYTSLHDTAIFDPIAQQTYDVRETSWDLGARVNVYYGKLSFGAGFGMEYQRYPNTMGVATRPLIDAHAALTFGSAMHTNAQLLVIGTGAFGSDNTNGPEGDIVSLRVALGLQI